MTAKAGPIMRHFWKSKFFQSSMIALGAIMLLVTPLIGLLPGPGGVRLWSRPA
jgi:hypothetical protein